jgi:hypothetical protein
VTNGAGAFSVPDYGVASLSGLLPAAAALLDMPITAADPGILRLPRAARVCVLIVDGLGAELLDTHAADAPFLATLAGRRLSAGFPATTATSMASLGTGTTPGVHGMLGYKVLNPDTGELLNLLRWDDRTDPVVWQPHPTVFEQLSAAGLPVFHVGPSAFASSPLTRAVWRGAEYVRADSAGSLVAATAHTVARERRSLTVANVADVDRAGPLYVSRSATWRHELAMMDRLVERLAVALPPDALLLVTADHGMVDVNAAGRVDVDACPELWNGVRLLGGEGRARHLYTTDGATGDVLAAWRDALGPRGWVRTRENAVAEGWFGPDVRPEILPRIGDVVVAVDTRTAVVATETEPKESMLFGMHGSLTSADLAVPLLAAVAGKPVPAP